MALGFLTNKEAREQITGLEARVSELETDVTAANASLSETQGELATANESLSESKVDLANALERITELETENAKIPDLEAAAELTKEKVSNEAARQLAASGHPAPIEDIDDKEEVKALSRAEFSALSPAAKSEFSKNGGKLTA